MTPDQTYALGVAVASLSLLIPAIRYPVLEAVSHPIILLLAVLSVAWLASIGFPLVAIVLTAIVLFLVRESTTFMSSVERRVYLDNEDDAHLDNEDDARFNPWYSVDLQVANRSLPFEAPKLHHVDHDAPQLLTYPPSQATLDELSGR